MNVQTPDWVDFQREMKILCEAYDRKHTDELDNAFWAALEHMNLRDFKRSAKLAVQKAGADGYDRMPKPGRFWHLRDEAIPRVQPRQQAMDLKPQKSWEQRYANICLLKFLITFGSASEESLQKLVAIKNKIATDFELIGTEEKVLAAEIKAELFKAFKLIWQPMNLGEKEQAA